MYIIMTIEYQTQISKPLVLLKDTAGMYLYNKITYKKSIPFILKSIMITNRKIIVDS